MLQRNVNTLIMLYFQATDAANSWSVYGVFVTIGIYDIRNIKNTEYPFKVCNYYMNKRR